MTDRSRKRQAEFKEIWRNMSRAFHGFQNISCSAIVIWFMRTVSIEDVHVIRAFKLPGFIKKITVIFRFCTASHLLRNDGRYLMMTIYYLLIRACFRTIQSKMQEHCTSTRCEFWQVTVSWKFPNSVRCPAQTRRSKEHNGSKPKGPWLRDADPSTPKTVIFVMWLTTQRKFAVSLD